MGAERLRARCELLTDGPIRTACDQLRRALGIGRQVGVAICERMVTPLLVGVVRPLILLPPAALNGWTTDNWKWCCCMSWPTCGGGTMR